MDDGGAEEDERVVKKFRMGKLCLLCVQSTGIFYQLAMMTDIEWLTE